MNDDQQFLSELRALLNKYNATICFSVSPCSDTHGLSDERMVVLRTASDTRKEREVFSVYNWALDGNDIGDSV